jgi:hypothetical protein
LDGVNVAFEKDLTKFTDFGRKNASSLGKLLYEFFRFYAHEFDFETTVASVRLGSHVAKSVKGWHMLLDNRLCVEEPFNINRNLANTADDTSMRGIHKELRRAFDLVSSGKLDECCQQFAYPTEEEVKPSSDFVPPQSRPIIAQAPPTQVPRSNKGPRNAKSTTHQKNNLASRRSSTSVNKQQMHLRNLPFQMNPQELQNQATYQQHLLHDQLYQQFQMLQIQEQELRARASALSQQNRHILAQQRGVYGVTGDDWDGSMPANLYTSNRGPLSAPLYQARFNAPSPFLPHHVPVNGIVTNPSSPHLTSAMPDTRRFPRRTSAGHSFATGSLRAQSQPPRPLVSSMSMQHLHNVVDRSDHTSSRRSSASTTAYENGSLQNGHRGQHQAEVPRKPSEYVGYIIGQSPSLYGYPQSASISPMPSHAGLAIHNGGLSPRLYGRSTGTSANGTTSTSPVREMELATPTRSSEQMIKQDIVQEDTEAETPYRRQGPLVVDGTVISPRRRQRRSSTHGEAEDPMTFSGSTSEDLPFDTPSSSGDSNHDVDASAAGTTPTKVENHFVNQAMLGSERPSSMLHAYALSRHLPAVQEVRTPSPSFAASPPPITNGNFSASAEPVVVKTSPLAQRESTNAGLAVKPNGLNGIIANGAHAVVTNASSWQTQKKKSRKKKGAASKSENDAIHTNPVGGEMLPANEAQQKGG